MTIDEPYLLRLIAYFKEVKKANDYTKIELKILTKAFTNENNKLINHVKHYIDNIRTKDLPDVYFTDDYLKLIIT